MGFQFQFGTWVLCHQWMLLTGTVDHRLEMV